MGRTGGLKSAWFAGRGTTGRLCGVHANLGWRGWLGGFAVQRLLVLTAVAEWPLLCTDTRMPDFSGIRLVK